MIIVIQKLYVSASFCSISGCYIVMHDEIIKVMPVVAL